MSTVAAPSVPLYDMGALTPRVRARATQSVRQPAYPLYDGWGLHGMGANPAQIVGATAPIAATGTATAITAAASSGAIGASWGAWAGPIGAGVGVLIGVIAGLLAAHQARVAGAKTENQHINSALQFFDAGLKAIFDAANSSDPTKNVSGPDAAAQVQQLYATFWQQMAPFTHGPGEADASGGGANCGSGLNPGGPCIGTPGGHKCDKTCTATCCVGCQDLYPTMLQAVQVLNSPSGGTVQACAVASSSYGASARAGYTLTYSPPTAQSVTGGLVSSVESLFSPSAGSASGGGSSLLLPLALLAGAFFLLR